MVSPERSSGIRARTGEFLFGDTTEGAKWRVLGYTLILFASLTQLETQTPIAATFVIIGIVGLLGSLSKTHETNKS